jgi:dTDP-glucose pyrophosphorylase
MRPTIIILAAGIGSRYGGLKQLDGVGPNNEPILEYSVYDAIRAGFGKLVFVIRPNFTDAFQAMVDRTFGAKIPVAYAYQELTMLPTGFAVPPERQKPWGTGHAILCAEPAVSEPFSAINADDFYGATAFKLLADYLKTAQDTDMADYSMVGYTLRNTLSEFGSVSRGVCQHAGDYLRHVVELTKIEKDGRRAKYTDEAGQVHPLSGDEIVSLNMWGFTPSIFGHLRQQFIQFLRERGAEAKSEFYIPTAVDALIAQRKAQVRILPSQEPWFGITYREDKLRVAQNIRDLIRQGVYPEKLWG